MGNKHSNEFEMVSFSSVDLDDIVEKSIAIKKAAEDKEIFDIDQAAHYYLFIHK